MALFLLLWHDVSTIVLRKPSRSVHLCPGHLLASQLALQLQMRLSSASLHTSMQLGRWLGSLTQSSLPTV